MVMRISRLILLVSLVIGSAGCDQWTKYQAVASLTHALDEAEGPGDRVRQYLWQEHPRPRVPVTVVEGFWRFRYAENPGAAFSFLANTSFGRWFLVAIGVIAVALFSTWAMRLRRALPVLGAALVLGGALGNLFDRVRLGYVIDFVQWHYLDRLSWPIFNVADVWIFVGGVILLFTIARSARESAAAAQV